MINFLENYTHVETRHSFMSSIAEFYKDILKNLFLKSSKICQSEKSLIPEITDSNNSLKSSN